MGRDSDLGNIGEVVIEIDHYDEVNKYLQLGWVLLSLYISVCI